MSGLIYHSDKRRVLPQIERANSYKETRNSKIDKGRISSGAQKPIIEYKDDDIQSKLLEWESNKSKKLAGEILSHAIVTNQLKDAEGIQNYLLANVPEDAILNWVFRDRLENIRNEIRIAHNRKKLIIEPKDAITWTDQAINYIEIGNREKAIKCVDAALTINSDSGFILRNASRIFNIIGDNGRAIKILKGSEYYKFDPQILSAEIAFSQLEKRKSHGPELGRKVLIDSKFTNHELSELSSSIGTMEYFNGNYKKSEELFDKALIDSNENSFAQSLWYKQNPIPSKKFAVYSTSSEIQTHKFFKKSKFEESLRHSLNWVHDEPFSSRPYRVASNLSGVILGNNKEAYHLAKDGFEKQKMIKVHLIEEEEMGFNNDLAYYLLRMDEIEKAEGYLNPLMKLLHKNTKLKNYEYFNIATLGLYAYKTKQYELGRRLYRKAIRHFLDQKSMYNARTAFLNFFVEEINILSEIEPLEKLKRELDSIISEESKNDILFLRKEALVLFDKKISSFK